MALSALYSDTLIRSEIIPTSKHDHWIHAGLFLSCLLVYLRTLCPTIFTDDCGEIATAVATGGVIHPPGYPLYTLIGSAFIKLIPYGEPAWRLGLVSSISAALTVVGVYHSTRRGGASVIWACASGLVFGFSIVLWQQATKVETYTLNALFVVALFNYAWTYSQSGRTRDLLAIAFFAGLSLTNHLTIICTLAAVAWLVLPRMFHDRNICRNLTAALIAFLAPLSLYALLWHNAIMHPGGQVWGDPSSWHRLYLHVTGAHFHRYFAQLNSAQVVRRDLIDLPATLWQNLSIFLIGVIPGTACLLYKIETRRIGIALLIALSSYLLETSLYGIPNIFEYYTPVILILSVLSGVGFHALQIGVTKRLKTLEVSGVRLSVALCTALVASSLICHWNYCDHSGAFCMRNLAINTLRQLPQNALLVVVGDNREFPLWYVQDVLHYRTDVALISRSGMSALDTPDDREEMSWLLRKLARQHPGIVDTRTILKQATVNIGCTLRREPLWQVVENSLAQNRPAFITDILPEDLITRADQTVVFAALPPTFEPVEYGLCNQIAPLTKRPTAVQLAQLACVLEKKIDIEYAQESLFAGEPDGAYTNNLYSAMLRRDADLIAEAGNSGEATKRMQIACKLSPTPDNYAHLAMLEGLAKPQHEALALNSSSKSNYTVRHLPGNYP